MPLLSHRDADRVENIVGERVDHVPHQLFDGYDRLQIAPELRMRGRSR